MNLLEIILIALGLSMDAFAVAISLGLSVKKPGIKEMATAGLYFGVFQALMPMTGFLLGVSFTEKIARFDHWIAFVLLGFIGGKMIKDSFSFEETHERYESGKNPFRFFNMLPLAVATSIDALAVGITFALFKVPIIRAAFLIGSITFVIGLCGVKIGNVFGLKYKAKAELAGGVVLVFLGIKIVVEHTLFAAGV
jgi:putative Mn2+ efflux pump MntP